MAEEINNLNENVMTQEQIDEEEKALQEAMEKFNSYRLNWTFRSIEYAINKENVSFTGKNPKHSDDFSRRGGATERMRGGIRKYRRE